LLADKDTLVRKYNGEDEGVTEIVESIERIDDKEQLAGDLSRYESWQKNKSSEINDTGSLSPALPVDL
jgi:hypothetical protein